MWVRCIQNVLFLWSSCLIGLLKNKIKRACLVIWRNTIFDYLGNSWSKFLLMEKWFSSLLKFVGVIKVHHNKTSIFSSLLKLPFITLYSPWWSSFIAFLLGVVLTMVLKLCSCFSIKPYVFIFVFLFLYQALHLLWSLSCLLTFMSSLGLIVVFIIVFLPSFKALC